MNLWQYSLKSLREIKGLPQTQQFPVSLGPLTCQHAFSFSLSIFPWPPIRSGTFCLNEKPWLRAHWKDFLLTSPTGMTQYTLTWWLPLITLHSYFPTSLLRITSFFWFTFLSLWCPLDFIIYKCGWKKDSSALWDPIMPLPKLSQYLLSPKHQRDYNPLLRIYSFLVPDPVALLSSALYEAWGL